MRYCFNCMTKIELCDDICPHCHKPTKVDVPPHHLFPGSVLNGKILIGKALGEGGFGITYVGVDLKSGEKVAVKEYYPNGYVNRANTVSATVAFSMSEDRRDFYEKGRSRFMNEARTLAMFAKTPGVVEVKDFFEANNTAYIVMEYLEGMDLKEHLKRNGPMPAAQVVNILRPVMAALVKIHAQGLIHRDISPDNIRITKDGVKLLDFGAARTVSAEANKSLSVMLKPGYAPEEQYRSRGNQGAWTDVYALSATMYKCITGKTPDDSNERVVDDQLKTPSQLGFAIDPVTEAAIMRGMGVFQRDRFQNVEQLLMALDGKSVPKSAPVTNDSATVQGSYVNPPVQNQGYNYNAQSVPVNTYQPQQSTLGQNIYQSMQPAAPQKSKKPLIIGICIALAVVAIVLAIVLAGGSDSGSGSGSYPSSNATSYETAVEGYVEAMAKGDISKVFSYYAGGLSYESLVDAMVAMAMEYGTGYSESEIRQILEEEMSYAVADLEEEFGKGYSVESEITYARDLSYDEIEEMLYEYNYILESFGKSLSASEISEAKYIECDGTIVGNGERETESFYMYAVKIGSYWKIIDMDTLGSML